MKQKALSKWLKAIIICMAILGLAVCFFALPMIGQSITHAYPEFSYCYFPWLILLWITGIPCFAVLMLGWKIAKNIGIDRSFTHENGRNLKLIAFLAAGDSGFLFIMNIVYILLNMNHPSVLLVGLVIEFVGVAISVVCAALSHLVNMAAELQLQSDLTI